MGNNIIVKYTNNYLTCHVIDLNNNSLITELRSDNAEVRNLISSKSSHIKNSLETSKIMANMLSKSLDKNQTYYFCNSTGKYRYHGKIKSFLEELERNSIRVKCI